MLSVHCHPDPERSEGEGPMHSGQQQQNFMICLPEPSAGQAEDEREICSLPVPRRAAGSSSLLLIANVILVLVFLVIGSMNSYSEERACSTAEARQADEGVDNLKSWDHLYQWYRRFHHCDDGGQAEGYSEAVARNLVDRWSTLPRLAQLARKDSRFRGFVLKHVNATLNPDDLKRIADNASTRCPAGVRSLCLELNKQAGTVIEFR